VRAVPSKRNDSVCTCPYTVLREHDEGRHPPSMRAEQPDQPTPREPRSGPPLLIGSVQRRVQAAGWLTRLTAATTGGRRRDRARCRPRRGFEVATVVDPAAARRTRRRAALRRSVRADAQPIRLGGAGRRAAAASYVGWRKAMSVASGSSARWTTEQGRRYSPSGGSYRAPGGRTGQSVNPPAPSGSASASNIGSSAWRRAFGGRSSAS
jgi:hypothetical protein